MMPPRPTPRSIWPPQPGYFQMRLVRRGWAVPARIVSDDREWYAIIDENTYLSHPDPAHAEGVATIWTTGQPITEATYDWLIALKAWARREYPDHPCLSPRIAINPATLRPIDPSLRPRPTGGADADQPFCRSIHTEDTIP